MVDNSYLRWHLRLYILYVRSLMTWVSIYSVCLTFITGSEGEMASDCVTYILRESAFYVMNERRDRTTTVCVSLWWSGGLRVVRLPAGSWHRFPRRYQGVCVRCVVSYSSTSFPRLVFFFGVLLWGSMIHKHAGRLSHQLCLVLWEGQKP